VFTRKTDRGNTIACFNEENHIRSLKLESQFFVEDIGPTGPIFTGSIGKELRKTKTTKNSLQP